MVLDRLMQHSSEEENIQVNSEDEVEDSPFVFRRKEGVQYLAPEPYLGAGTEQQYAESDHAPSFPADRRGGTLPGAVQTEGGARGEDCGGAEGRAVGLGAARGSGETRDSPRTGGPALGSLPGARAGGAARY